MARDRDRKNAREREKRANDPEYAERLYARRRERYATDVAYRESVKARQRQRYAANRDSERAKAKDHWKETMADPDARKAHNARVRDRSRRMRADPEWKARERERQREADRRRMANPEHRAKRAAYQRQRRANDPTIKERERLAARARYAARKAAAVALQPIPPAIMAQGAPATPRLSEPV